jgi:hypothetical protein
MFRIDNSSAVASRPAPQDAGSPGYFGRGDPAAGTSPTILTADWANMVQEELLAPIIAAGLTPSKSTVNQLLTALQQLFVSQTVPYIVASSFGSTSMYVQWSNGFKIQVQDVAVTSTTTQTFSYASAFNNWSRAWVNGDDGLNDLSVFVTGTTATTATVHSAISGTITAQLFSIGR